MSHRNTCTLWCSTSWFASFSFLALEAKLCILFNNHNKGFEMYMYIKSSHHTGRFFWPPLIPWVKSDFSFNSLTSTSQFLYQSLGQFRLIKFFFFVCPYSRWTKQKAQENTRKSFGWFCEQYAGTCTIWLVCQTKHVNKMLSHLVWWATSLFGT